MGIFNPDFRIYSGILSSCCCFVLATIGLLRNTNEQNNNLFIISNVSLGLWNISDLLTASSNQSWAIWIDRASYVFALLIVPSFFLLVIQISSKTEKFRPPKILIAGIIFFVLISPTSLLIKEVQTSPTFNEIPGKLYPLFVLFFLSWLCYGLIQIYIAFKKSRGFIRNQLKYFCLALCIAFIASINYFLGIFIQGTPPLYYLLVILYSVIVAYAVIRYRLMDFDLIIRWGFAYGLLAVMGTLIFILITYALEKILYLHVLPGFPTLLAVLILVFLFDPLKTRITSFIDKFIFQSPDFKAILGDIDESLKSHAEILSLTRSLSNKFKSIWKVDHAGILLWDSKNAEFTMLPREEFENQIIARMETPITFSDFLVKTLESERRLFQYGIIIEDEVTAFGNRSSPGERTTFWKIRRTMRWLGAAICVPIMTDNCQLMGLLVLGQKNSRGFYNREDKKFLSHVSQMISVTMKGILVPKIQGG